MMANPELYPYMIGLLVKIVQAGDQYVVDQVMGQLGKILADVHQKVNVCVSRNISVSIGDVKSNNTISSKNSKNSKNSMSMKLTKQRDSLQYVFRLIDSLIKTGDM